MPTGWLSPRITSRRSWSWSGNREANAAWALSMKPDHAAAPTMLFAKRAIAYGASLGVQKYMQAISEKQELLGVLADSIILTFGMDSAISRTLQLMRERGEEKSRIPTYMTQLFVAKAHEQVFDLLREMLMWMSQDDEWGREIRDINSYYSLDRVNTFSLRRKIALHVLEAGGYAL